MSNMPVARGEDILASRVFVDGKLDMGGDEGSDSLAD